MWMFRQQVFSINTSYKKWVKQGERMDGNYFVKSKIYQSTPYKRVNVKNIWRSSFEPEWYYCVDKDNHNQWLQHQQECSTGSSTILIRISKD